MPSVGLLGLGGLAEGLKSGLLAYQDQKKYLDTKAEAEKERAYKDQLMNVTMAKEGLYKDGEQIKKRLSPSEDASSQESIDRGFLAKKFGIGSGSGLTADAYKQISPLIENAQKEGLLKNRKTNGLIDDRGNPIPKTYKDIKSEQKEARAKEAEQDKAAQMVQDIGRAREYALSNPLASGKIAGRTSFIPGTPASVLEDLLEPIRANIAFDTLQKMRANSPTGGALGSVSEKEMALLQGAMGRISQSTDSKVLDDNLKRLSNLYNDVVHGPGNGPKRFELSFDEHGKDIGLIRERNKPKRPDFGNMSDEELRAYLNE